MKYLNKIILFFLPVLGNSVEYNSEISLSSEGPRLFDKSSLKFSGTLYDHYDGFTRSWLINPKIYYAADGQSSFSLSAGLRNDVSSVCIGNHIFFNICNVLGDPVYQFGKSFDVLHDKWEARVNYYFPCKLKAADLLTFYDIANQIEGEFIYKTPYCSFGGSHLYDFNNRKHSPTLKVSLPFDDFTIGTNLTLKNFKPCKFGVSIGYNFFSSTDTSKKSKNAVYNHLPKFERRFFEPITKKVVKVPVTQPVTVAPVVITEAPKAEPTVEPVSWWNWLFSRKKPDVSNSSKTQPELCLDWGSYGCSDSNSNYSTDYYSAPTYTDVGISPGAGTFNFSSDSTGLSPCDSSPDVQFGGGSSSPVPSNDGGWEVMEGDSSNSDRA